MACHCLSPASEPRCPYLFQCVQVVGEKRADIVDTWWQTETGMHMITPLPGCTPLKAGAGKCLCLCFPAAKLQASCKEGMNTINPPAWLHPAQGRRRQAAALGCLASLGVLVGGRSEGVRWAVLDVQAGTVSATRWQACCGCCGSQLPHSGVEPPLLDAAAAAAAPSSHVALTPPHKLSPLQPGCLLRRGARPLAPD